MRKFAKADEEAEINMTPMLDIVFIMLIFFIVTASFVKGSAVDINKPPPAPEQDDDDDNKSILVRIDDSNRIRVAESGKIGRRIDIRSVRPNIERLHAAYPDAPVVIQPQPDAHAGIVIQIIDQALEAKVDPSKISVVE